MAAKTGLGINELQRQTEAVLRLAEQYGASNPRVWLRRTGEARPDSDLDLLVDFPANYRLWDKIGLKQDIEELLGRKVDIVNARFIRRELAPAILRDAIPL
jgi:predicted nucleotidyltransferase